MPVLGLVAGNGDGLGLPFLVAAAFWYLLSFGLGGWSAPSPSQPESALAAAYLKPCRRLHRRGATKPCLRPRTHNIHFCVLHNGRVHNHALHVDAGLADVIELDGCKIFAWV